MANGELVSYDLRLGTEAIAREVEGAAASKLLRLDDIQVHTRVLVHYTIIVRTHNSSLLEGAMKLKFASFCSS